MSKKLVILALLVAMIYCTFAFPQGSACGPNQIFDTCGSACQPSCKNPFPDVCVLKCVIGCRCEDGFIENADGNCVLTQDCS
ncbi:chymotrypsin inhibitor-like [Vespula squamosa]|uniref:Chymotrypsin inhibitor-like n=1 Tax=Vespula squamosa TaxID=30214 RepID=A0ABD2AHS6_VESSQ